MVKRIAEIAIAPVALICFGICVAGMAACQSVSPALEGPTLSGPTFVASPSSVVTPSSLAESLPESPSVEAAALKEFDEMRRTGGMRPDQFESLDNAVRPRDTKTIFDRYFSRPVGPVAKVMDPNENGSLMGRATHAAVGVFVVRDESGKGRINTSYFLRALTAVAADTASRPYWRRSPGEPLADFGSTVGNDAGMNLLHEFGPGLQQMMKSHAPRFVTRIAEKVARN